MRDYFFMVLESNFFSTMIGTVTGGIISIFVYIISNKNAKRIEIGVIVWKDVFVLIDDSIKKINDFGNFVENNSLCECDKKHKELLENLIDSCCKIESILKCFDSLYPNAYEIPNELIEKLNDDKKKKFTSKEHVKYIRFYYEFKGFHKISSNLEKILLKGIYKKFPYFIRKNM